MRNNNKFTAVDRGVTTCWWMDGVLIPYHHQHHSPPATKRHDWRGGRRRRRRRATTITPFKYGSCRNKIIIKTPVASSLQPQRAHHHQQDEMILNAAGVCVGLDNCYHSVVLVVCFIVVVLLWNCHPPLAFQSFPAMKPSVLLLRITNIILSSSPSSSSSSSALTMHD